MDYLEASRLLVEKSAELSLTRTHLEILMVAGEIENVRRSEIERYVQLAPRTIGYHLAELRSAGLFNKGTELTKSGRELYSEIHRAICSIAQEVNGNPRSMIG